MSYLVNPFRAPLTDPSIGNVVLLCGFDSSIVDEIASPHTLTTVGNAARSTSVTKFGAGSLVMDGSGDRVTAANSADWSFGSGDFTVEGWFRFLVKQNNQALLGMWDNAGSAANSAWYFWITGGRLDFRVLNAAATTFDVQATFVPTLSQWYHLAVTKGAGNRIDVWADGTSIANGTPVTTSVHASTAKLVIGAVGDTGNFSANDFNGNMDEIRITKGGARYTSNFTPPTAPFPRT